MLELYKNIRKFRIALEMSQAELAKKTGYNDRSSIAKIERGDVDLPQSKIILFANALHVTPGELMGDVEISVPLLTASEKAFLGSFRKLNSDGQQRVRLYMEDLLSLEKYTEPTPEVSEKHFA